MSTPQSSTARRSTAQPPKTNGAEHDPGLDLRELLRALQAVRDGDFSVRLPSDKTGLAGKVADTFNEIVLSNQQMAQRARARRPDRRQGGQDPTSHDRAIGAAARGARWKRRVNTLIDDLLWPTTEVTRTITAVAKGDLSQTMPLEVDGRPLEGEFLRSAKVVNAMIQQMSAFTSEVTRVAREVGTEGKLGGQAVGAGRGGHLEGPDRQRQLDGQQPDRPGAQYRRSHDRGRQRRPVAQDHGRRARRDPAAQGSHQHDGRPAALLRLRGHARGARGRHRGQARRPGDRARRRRHLEGPDRLGQRDGDQPHRPGAQHRRGDHRGGARRPVAQDHGGRAGRDPAS